MFYGVDTQGVFIGHSPGLRKAIDQATAMRFDDGSVDDTPASLEYLFTQMLIGALVGGSDFHPADGCYVEMVYGAIDDNILRHAIDAGHVRTLKINRNGYYLANGGGDNEQLQRSYPRSDSRDQRNTSAYTFQRRAPGTNRVPSLSPRNRRLP